MCDIYPIREDAMLIAEAMHEYPSYVFSEDLCSRMEKNRLSSPELGRRCLVSHTIVDKWRSGKAVPKGKERFKELGMALGMNADRLSEFLFKNGYPPLHARNPFDSAAKLLLRDHTGKSDVVPIYREMIKRLGLETLKPRQGSRSSAGLSAAMSLELKKLSLSQSISNWFAAHAQDFRADGKNVIPGRQLAEFLILYMGEASIQEMYISGELPVTLRNLLYPILSGKAVAAKNLRDKLIAFGLYCSMTEDEIDTVLQLAGLRPFSDVAGPADAAVLMAVRLGHENYPLYENENLHLISQELDGSGISEELKADFAERLEFSETLKEYYLRHEKTPKEQAFEELYTSYSARCLMDYVKDVIVSLIKENVIEKKEVDKLLEYISREREDTTDGTE